MEELNAFKARPRQWPADRANATEPPGAEGRAAAEFKATLLAELDARHSRLADLRARARGAADGSSEAQDIEQQLADLDGLRQQVVLTGGIHALASLQYQIGDVARQGADRAASGPAFMATADYQRRSAELAREADHSLARNDRLFRDAVGVAERHGVDLSAFVQERARLHKERDEAERRGDHLKARMADALIARTTTNALTETLPHIADPAERARQHVRIEQAKQEEEAARKRLERQAEHDGRKQATERHLSPEAAKAHVESVKHDTLRELEAEKEKLHRPGAVRGSRADLDPAPRSGQTRHHRPRRQAHARTCRPRPRSRRRDRRHPPQREPGSRGQDARGDAEGRAPKR